jgi:hypothetical protein
MNIFDLFESPKLAAPSNTPGVQTAQDQHTPSPIGSGTSKREAKKRKVTMMGVPVSEAGPFSYGAKKPRKGSVADLAAKKRQEQEKDKQPVEPRDHMVGVARVKKDVAEGRGNIEALRTELMGEYLNIYYNALDGWNMTDHIINLQDVYGRVKRSRDPVLQQTYNLLMDHAEESIDVQASAALKAIRILGDEPNYTPPPRPPMSPEDSARADAFVNQFLAALVSHGIKTHPDWHKNNDKGVAEGSAQDKLHKRHQELRKKSGLPDPDYYKELKATYDLPDTERHAKAAELKKKYNVKEGILDRSPAKLPKPRNPAERVLRTKVNAAGQHTNKKRQQQLQPKHRVRDDLDEGWKSALAGAALAGATALGGGAAQAGDIEKLAGPLPIMATIVIKMPDGQTKTFKKDLGNAYDYKMDDAKKDLENLLDKKGIKNYSIHLDRYDSNEVYVDKNKPAQPNKDMVSKSSYVDTTPYQAKSGTGSYADNTPYKATPTSVNYLDKAKVNEISRRGFLKTLGAAALGGAGISAGAQEVDTIARITMIVDGEKVERVVNIGPVSSIQAAHRAISNELRSKGIEQFTVNLERGAPPPTAPVHTRPGPYGSRGITNPGGVADTAGQVASDIGQGEYGSAANKAWKSYQHNKNADLGAIGRGEVKDRVVNTIKQGIDKLIPGLNETNQDIIDKMIQMAIQGYRDQEIAQKFNMDLEQTAQILDAHIEDIEAGLDDLNEAIESRLMQLKHAGYDIIFEDTELCPECGGPAYSNPMLAEKKDACYSKVKSRYKVWPSAYASGALVRCRKVGAANWGNKSKK